MRRIALIFPVVFTLIISAGIAIAQANNPQSDITGIYMGRQLGVGGGQEVTLSLMPSGDATVAVAPIPGAYPLISRGTWRMVTRDQVRLYVAGPAGSGIMYFNRFGNQLNEVQQGVGLTSTFPLQLFKQQMIR